MDIGDFMKLNKKIDDLLKRKDKIFIAIEGSCGSGKTTLAETLSKYYPATIFKTDDYFLPSIRKTKERLEEPGGNIDYERMKTEVFNHLNKDEISVRKFHCKTNILEESRMKQLQAVNIVEGVYSAHPYFKFEYDLIIFLDIDKETQLKRLEARNKALLSKFVNQWIPLENKYFKYFKIRNKANIILTLESSDL